MVSRCVISILSNVSTDFFNTEEKKLTPGTVAYGEISLVVSTQGLVMARAKDSKAVSRLLPPNAKGHEPPQVEADIFDEHGDSSGSGSNSDSQQPDINEQPTCNPYKVVQTAKTKVNPVMDAELDGLMVFDESDLPEIALVDDATFYPARKVPRHGQQYNPDNNWHYCAQREEPALRYTTTHVHWDKNTNIRQGSERRTEIHEHYKVPHQGDLGGHQYRQLVVDIPKKVDQVPSMTRTVLPQARSTGDHALPVLKARIGAPAHVPTGQKPAQSSNLHPRLHPQPLARTLPPTHPANRIPPPGQKFNKGKAKSRVHAAQSTFPLRVRQEQDEYTQQPLECDQTRRFVHQRLPHDGQAGPSREIFLTQEEDLRRRHAFAEDAYMHAVYEDDEEEN